MWMLIAVLGYISLHKLVVIRQEKVVGGPLYSLFWRIRVILCDGKRKNTILCILYITSYVTKNIFPRHNLKYLKILTRWPNFDLGFEFYAGNHVWISSSCLATELWRSVLLNWSTETQWKREFIIQPIKTPSLLVKIEFGEMISHIQFAILCPKYFTIKRIWKNAKIVQSKSSSLHSAICNFTIH